jgi:HPt (histidine-containing phosphotransfer) domain-containing protein
MATDPMTQPETIAPEKQSNEQKLQAMLAALWDRSKHTVAERAVLLQVAVDLWMQDRLDEPTRQGAVDSAHKLAGVLGTFGLPRGTDLARRAEVLFGESTSAGKEEIGQLQLLLAELTKLIEIGPLGPR